MNKNKVLFLVTFLFLSLSVGGQYGGVGANCGLHPLIHTFGYRLMPPDIMVGQKGLAYESLKFFLRTPLEMVQTLHLQSIQAVLGALYRGSQEDHLFIDPVNCRHFRLS